MLWIFPVAWWLSYRQQHSLDVRIKAYADAALLPHLTGTRALQKNERHLRLLQWRVIWCCLVVAMAGPRWDFRSTEVYAENAELVVLLDLSQSMNAQDESPNRLVRAKQEVADLLALKESFMVGMVVFASVAHVVHPLTQDQQALMDVLPLLNTDLLTYTGSRLVPALSRSLSLFSQDDGRVSQHIVLLTDGDFSNENLTAILKQLQHRKIFLHVLVLGSAEGGQIPLGDDVLRDAVGKPIISRVNLEKLQNLAEENQGLFLKADYRDEDIRQIVQKVKRNAELKQNKELQTKIWNERFYLFLLPLLLLLVPKFRRFWSADELGGDL